MYSRRWPVNPARVLLALEFSPGWHEANDRKKGYFESRWGVPRSWNDVILQGPHLYVATPMYKSPNPTMKNKEDWSATDFEALALGCYSCDGIQADWESRSIRCRLYSMGVRAGSGLLPNRVARHGGERQVNER